ncbi:MAG TPA: polysaccharide pyruvyl transferase family protein [Candidatus Caenarcaniphilales bacterium]
MKKPILSLLLTLYTAVLRFLRVLKLGGDQDLSVLILPPAALGSLGDEAMVSASIEYFRDKGAKKIGLISYGSISGWENYRPATGTVDLRHHYFRGFWKGKFHFAQVVSGYKRFYCLGADVMDGYYSEFDTLQRLSLVALAAKTGADAAVLGFSFNNQPKPACVQAFRDLPSAVSLCARDPVSHERLVHHLNRPVKLVADLAFLLHPANDSEIASSVVEWIGEQRSQNRSVIGVNANYKLVQSLEVQSLDNLTEIYVDTLSELYAKNNQFSFVLISHDFRNIKGEVNDVVLSEAIWKALPTEIQSHCIKVPAPCSAAEIKAIGGDLDIVLSGRMHLAIACLGQGTPAACITYQGKFEGLFRHFGLEGMNIEPAQALQPKNLVEFLIPLIDRQAEIRQHIQLKLPQVQQLAHTNFE